MPVPIYLLCVRVCVFEDEQASEHAGIYLSPLSLSLSLSVVCVCMCVYVCVCVCEPSRTLTNSPNPEKILGLFLLLY